MPTTPPHMLCCLIRWQDLLVQGGTFQMRLHQPTKCHKPHPSHCVGPLWKIGFKYVRLLHTRVRDTSTAMWLEQFVKTTSDCRGAFQDPEVLDLMLSSLRICYNSLCDLHQRAETGSPRATFGPRLLVTRNAKLFNSLLAIIISFIFSEPQDLKTRVSYLVCCFTYKCHIQTHCRLQNPTVKYMFSR
jgi:hypothetical protein